jgi:hypothetical protein
MIACALSWIKLERNISKVLCRIEMLDRKRKASESIFRKMLYTHFCLSLLLGPVYIAEKTQAVTVS